MGVNEVAAGTGTGTVGRPTESAAGNATGTGILEGRFAFCREARWKRVEEFEVMRVLLLLVLPVSLCTKIGTRYKKYGMIFLVDARA